MSAPVVWEHRSTDIDGSRTEGLSGGDWLEVVQSFDADGALIEGEYWSAPMFGVVSGTRLEVANALWALAAEALLAAVALRGEQ